MSYIVYLASLHMLKPSSKSWFASTIPPLLRTLGIIDIKNRIRTECIRRRQKTSILREYFVIGHRNLMSLMEITLFQYLQNHDYVTSERDRCYVWIRLNFSGRFIGATMRLSDTFAAGRKPVLSRTEQRTHHDGKQCNLTEGRSAIIQSHHAGSPFRQDNKFLFLPKIAKQCVLLSVFMQLVNNLRKIFMR